MIAQHSTKSLSGTLEQTSELGLPDVPQVRARPAAPPAARLLELLTGPHTARVYPRRARQRARPGHGPAR